MANQKPALQRKVTDKEAAMVKGILQSASGEMSWSVFCSRWVPVLFGVTEAKSPVDYKKACQKLFADVFPEITNKKSVSHWRSQTPLKNARRLYSLDLQFRLCIEETRNTAFREMICHSRVA